MPVAYLRRSGSRYTRLAHAKLSSSSKKTIFGGKYKRKPTGKPAYKSKAGRPRTARRRTYRKSYRRLGASVSQTNAPPITWHQNGHGTSIGTTGEAVSNGQTCINPVVLNSINDIVTMFNQHSDAAGSVSVFGTQRLHISSSVRITFVCQQNVPINMVCYLITAKRPLTTTVGNPIAYWLSLAGTEEDSGQVGGPLVTGNLSPYSWPAVPEMVEGMKSNFTMRKRALRIMPGIPKTMSFSRPSFIANPALVDQTNNFVVPKQTCWLMCIAYSDPIRQPSGGTVGVTGAAYTYQYQYKYVSRTMAEFPALNINTFSGLALGSLAGTEFVSSNGAQELAAGTTTSGAGIAKFNVA